ncbi:glutathione S-transferase family protein [Pseudomonas sp. PB101]|uniref:glutathione S-transferase family protein n=1 Tax=Pseudomonas sp. PB101 TaxID=2495428 RepID=UPI001365EE8B|nr:glutathione S-transferase [Pseudomonas sp. PB101]MVW84804.1 glutathione S-transferase family protein [Pseudomonas sp. PB101]
MIRLHDYFLSGSCYKVRLMLNLLGLQAELVPVDFVAKEHKRDAFSALNPFGELPCFEDGELRLRDSQAILVYLATRYDAEHQWYSNDPCEQGLIQQWLSTGGGEVMNACAARLVKSLNYPLDLDKLHLGAHRVFKIMDAHLATREYLELGRPTIADIACFPYSALAWEGGIDISGYTHLVSWIERIKKLDRFIGMPGIS